MSLELLAPEPEETENTEKSRPGFAVDYRNAPFLLSSNTGSDYEFLNWRCEVILRRNADLIRGRRVLDLASHDGRMSYACLELGAAHVAGVEGRKHLVDYARNNFQVLCQDPSRYRFEVSDVFEFLKGVQPGDYDTILCLGFLYHTVHHGMLFGEFQRLAPADILLDTNVFITHRIHIDRFLRSGLGRFYSFLKKFGIGKALTDLIEKTANERALFLRPDLGDEGSSTDPAGLRCIPTLKGLALMMKSYKLQYKRLDWTKEVPAGLRTLETYRQNRRVSFRIRSGERQDL